MLVRKPSILIATSGCLNFNPANIHGSSTSLTRRRKSTRQQRCAAKQEKSYATVTGDNNHHQENVEYERYSWPEPPKGQPCPTPYQILAMKDNAVYSKTRYYELVKLYHPDRATLPANNLPQAVKLERYRLIVAAHTILSDPTKRSAYDRFGAGWNGKAEVGGRETWYQASPFHPAGPFSRSWQDPNDPVWRNATWEDWERYYEWRAQKEGTRQGGNRQHQSPLYLRNSYFVLLVAALAMMGSTANYTRAHDNGAYFVEQRDIIHDRAARELRKVREDATHSGSRQDRIDWFIRNRDATLGAAGSDIEALRQEKIDRLLPDREICNSEGVVEKG